MPGNSGLMDWILTIFLVAFIIYDVRRNAER